MKQRRLGKTEAKEMKMGEIVAALVLLAFFSAALCSATKPFLRLKAENDRKERVLNRDIFIQESFLGICGKKKNLCEEDFSKWLCLCKKEFSLPSICVRKIGVKDKSALWKVEWDGKELYAISKEL
jgi:hypothetical protein